MADSYKLMTDRHEIAGWSRDIASYERVLRLKKTLLLGQSRDYADTILRGIEERWPHQAKIFSDMRKEADHE